VDRLTEKVGPLPAWVWAVIVVGVGYVAYRYIGSRGAKTSAAPIVDGSSDAVESDGSAVGATGTDGGDDSGDYSADPTDDNDSDAGAATGSSIVGPGQFQDDDEWSAYAAMHLAAGGADPIAVSNALTDYLAGNPLSVSEAALISEALIAYGTPPGGLIPITLTTTPTNTTTTPTTPTTNTTPTPTPTPTPAAKAPDTPGGFSLGSSGLTLLFSWDASAGATFYQILRVDGTLYWQGTGTSLQNPNQQAGHTYTFSVRAGNAAGLSAPTLPHVHTIPANITAGIG
jgi:hypothetical protein